VPDLILDNWAALSHKAAIAEPSTTSYGPQPWTWIGAENKRRLTAYTILEAYRRNVARWYVQASSEEQRAIRREYGDPDLLMRQIAASVLGRGYRISVEGADDEGKNADDSGSTSGPATSRQEELARWSDDEQMALKLLDNEHTCLSLGDSVMWLTYSAKKKRVRCHLLDPGFYFPVIPGDDDGEDFPERVHLAWEFEQWDKATAKTVRYVRRITYELRDVPAYRVKYQSKAATQRCYMTDATWTMDDLNWDMRNQGPDDFQPQKATFRTNEDGQAIDELDLGIDFIPVLHLANMGGKPWGQSIYTSVAHILDDLQMADTDAAEAADVAGGPPIVVAGADGSEAKTYGPKTVWTVPTGGQASVLDTSKGLDSLENHEDKLFKRLTVNMRTPREILGITGAAEVPSGTAFSLGFHPFKMLIGEVRLSRKFKYGLLYKMTQRMMIAFGQWSGEVRPATIKFGAALPEDVSATVALVKELAAADRPLISRLTGLEMLADVGLPIEDPAEELAAVHGEDFDAARLIQMATDSTELAADHLGIDIPDVTREEKAAQEQAQTAADAVQQAASMRNNAQAAHDGATVAETPRDSSGAGTGTRKPGVNGGSNTGNGRRRRRGN
jgi:hypothetical protein